MTMTINKLKAILVRYGTDANAWPAADRSECEALLASSEEASALLMLFEQQEHEQLNRVLNESTVPAFPGLEARVLHQKLPAQARSFIDQILDWLIPARPLGLQFWRPAMAACLPLVFGILVGNFFSFGVTTENQGFEYWDDELYVLSLNDYTENVES